MKTKLALLLLMVCGLASNAGADDIKVIKVSGRRAIVQYPPGETPKVGQVLTSSGSDEMSFDDGGNSSSKGSRKHIIGGSASLSFVNSSTSPGSGSVTTTNISVSPQYGWNTGTMEYGGLASIGSSSGGGTSSTSFGVGGFFDYNLVPNVAGKDLVYGAGGKAIIGGGSSSGQSSTSFELDGGPFVKWFPLGNSVAIRGDADVQYKRMGNSAATTTNMGLVIMGGLYVYF